MSDVTVSEVKVLACAEAITLKMQHRHEETKRELDGEARGRLIALLPCYIVHE